MVEINVILAVAALYHVRRTFKPSSKNKELSLIFFIGAVLTLILINS